MHPDPFNPVNRKIIAEEIAESSSVYDASMTNPNRHNGDELIAVSKTIEDAQYGFSKLPPLKRPFGEGLDTTPKPGEQE